MKNWIKNRWGIILAIINVACLMAVTTVSIVVWAVNDKNKDIAGNGTVTITGAISAEMTAGKQVNGGGIAALSGTVGGSSVPLTGVDIQNLSVFSIGNIDASAGEYINVYFTIKNKSATDTLKVTAFLTNGTPGAAFADDNVETTKYTTGELDEDIEDALEKLNWALTDFAPDDIRTEGINWAALGGASGASYLAYHGITPYGSFLSIPPNKTRTLVVRYDMGTNATTFTLGIDLNFEVVAA